VMILDVMIRVTDHSPAPQNDCSCDVLRKFVCQPYS